MKKITVNLENAYNIYIDNSIDINKCIKEIYDNKKIYLICDESLNKHELDVVKQLEMFEVFVIRITSSEQTKTLTTFNYIITKLLELGITRDSLIISLGGGVVGDVVGFVASTILRGIKYVSIPTTLLSQVDSSIGGKTALNVDNKKNMIGTFYQPSLVLINTKYLDTLSKDELYNGLGEVIKCALIKDDTIIPLLKEKIDYKEIIYKSLLVKKYFVEKDPFDQNERMILNFGHTFGHAIELEKNIKHGYAVIEGMLQIINYGIDLGITNKELLSVLINILNELKIDFLNLNYKDYLTKLSNDKKRNEDGINFIFLEKINKVIIKKI